MHFLNVDYYPTKGTLHTFTSTCSIHDNRKDVASGALFAYVQFMHIFCGHVKSALCGGVIWCRRHAERALGQMLLFRLPRA